MMGFGTRKKTEVSLLVIEPTIQEQLATALAKVEECDAKIKQHDEQHLQFVQQNKVITDGESIDNPLVNPQAPASLSDVTPVEIMQEFHDYRLKRNHLQHEFSLALAAWADLKQRVSVQPGLQ